MVVSIESGEVGISHTLAEKLLAFDSRWERKSGLSSRVCFLVLDHTVGQAYIQEYLNNTNWT